MGLLDQVVGGLLGGSGGGKDEGLLGIVTNLMSDSSSGGLAGLLEAFRGKGLGEAVSSWVSTGQNLPISGEQILKVFGSEKVRGFAEQLGLSETDVSGGLADLLPRVVDKLTPDGSLPDTQALDQGIGLLKSKIFGA